MGCTSSSSDDDSSRRGGTITTRSDGDRRHHHTDTTINTHTRTDTNNAGGQDQNLNGTKTDTTTQEDKNTNNQTDTQEDPSTKKDADASETQYDDAGFFGETEKDKGEQELFDGGEKKPEEASERAETQNDDSATTEEKTDADVIVLVAEEKKEETQPEPEPEPEPEEPKSEPEPEPEPEPEELKPEPEPAEKEEAIKPEEREKQRSDEPDIQDGDLGGYTQTSTGLKGIFLDFRSSKQRNEDEKQMRRPSVAPGQLWRDTDFGLHEAIGDPSLSQTLTWKRPSELSASPKLFSEGTTRYDIGQGGAGTCWFLSTVANISEHPEQLRLVIPEENYPEDGVFHSRFWKFGKWEDVYIDDYLPIVYDTIPWGARSATDDSEFWPSLLEKSFARYHGNYQAVYGGQPGDAYLALTGGVAERIDFDDNEHKPTKLYQRIHNAVNSGALVTCTVPDKYDKVHGLVGGHAYSLTGTAMAKNTRLLRVRNPWGNTEWKGPWSDGSSEWNGVSRFEVAQVEKDDGEFWISLDDFMTYFDQTTICSLTPDFDQDGCSDSLNYVTNVFGEWRGDTAAGFRERLQNPRFLFTVPDTGESEVPIVVQLIQNRKDRQMDNFQVRCDLFKVLHDDGSRAALELLGEKTNSYCPETQCSFRHKVTPGTYAAVPSTIDAGLEKSFLIRTFSACPLSRVGDLSREHRIMSCDHKTSITHDGHDHPLTHCQVMAGQWKAGVNAGGQVGKRDSHATNPQYVITVSQPTLVALYLMQQQVDPRMPLGMRLLPTGDAPLDIDTIYQLHDESVVNTDGSSYKFVDSWDVETAYMLQPGSYTLLLHLNDAGSEKHYTLAVKSPSPVDIKAFQTVA